MQSEKIKRKNIKILSFLFSATFISLIQFAFSRIDALGFIFIQLLPLILSLLFLQFIVDTLKRLFGRNCQSGCFAFNIVFSFITLPIFLGVYFGIFNPIHSIAYEKVENCQVIGIAPMAQPSYEIYTILYVDFEYEQQKFLGYACTSNQWQNINNYFSISKGDSIPCDNVGASYDTPYNKRVRLLRYQQKQDQEFKQQGRKRYLRQRGNCRQAGKSKVSPYNFSNIKLASWMCQPRNKETYETLIKQRTCYINFREKREKSYQNSKNRLNLRETYYFAIVEFELPVYYPRLGLIALIILCFYPSNMLIYPLFKIILLQLRNNISKLYQKIE
ncbi:hypothetical protein ABPG72_014255 [Tetrahymena utriculariae]